MKEDDIWDRELTMAQFKALPPELQKKRIDASLRRKIAEVIRWSAQGVPKSVDWRKTAGSRARLRQWHDPKKKLWSWSADTPDDPQGRNRGVMKKWRNARSLLAAGRTAQRRSELDIWRERALALEVQNTQLIAEKASLEELLLRLEERSYPAPTERRTP